MAWDCDNLATGSSFSQSGEKAAEQEFIMLAGGRDCVTFWRAEHRTSDDV